MTLLTTTPELPGILGSLAPLLNHYGYAAVAVLIMLEDFGIPAPGETVLIAAAVYAGAGQLNIALVIVVGIVAAVVGDNIGFAIGHFGGRALVLRFGRYVWLTEERLAAAERFFERYGAAVVILARFVEGLRQLNGILAGISGMHWRKFLVFNILGATLWVGLWATLGYAAGTHITPIYAEIRRYQGYVLAALAVLVIALVARRLLRRRRNRVATKPMVSPRQEPPT
ncbi:DedA family protein [Saccharomonospora sp. NPDC046836]|uniref:DedA family protein n=1 Tax=Saccharomonospora sp. NPDC046836 TaxID=3156921 RepID=UPI00340A4BBA